MLDFLLAPAILAGLLVFALARFHESRQQVIAQLRAATAIQVELVSNVTALRRFTATFRATADRMLGPETYEPFIPVDDRSAMIFDHVKDHLLHMDRNTIRDVSRYYKTDQQINKLLVEICSDKFAAARAERRREVLVYTMLLLENGLQEGEAAIRSVRGFLRKRRRGATLVGYDRAQRRLLRSRLSRTLLGPPRAAVRRLCRRQG